MAAMAAVGTSRHLAIYVRVRGEPDIAAQREASGQKLGRATWGRGGELSVASASRWR
jgi:hypothetical protein